MLKLKIALCVLVVGVIASYTYYKSHANRYENLAYTPKLEAGIINFVSRLINDDTPNKTPKGEIPVNELTTKDILNLLDDQDSVIRLGHSSLLIKVNGDIWLIDPMFSDRASPVSFYGPQRFSKNPISVAQLPDIKGVIVTHDHYDHLDKESIENLSEKTEHFVVPEGVDNHLTLWGVGSDKIHSLNWWQSVSINGVTITSTPAQHFSGRSLLDKDATLWSSYVIQSPNSDIYYSGDTGYFEGFKEIGRKFGPFDLTILENGAFDSAWPNVHMFPAEAIQAYEDLGGQADLLPVHNATFSLAFHSWDEPLKQISKLASDSNIPLATPIIGETLIVGKPSKTFDWWN